MGYAHYWRSASDIPPDTWRAISDDVRKQSNYFYDELVRILADGDSAALGL